MLRKTEKKPSHYHFMSYGFYIEVRTERFSLYACRNDYHMLYIIGFQRKPSLFVNKSRFLFVQILNRMFAIPKNDKAWHVAEKLSKVKIDVWKFRTPNSYTSEIES